MNAWRWRLLFYCCLSLFGGCVVGGSDELASDYESVPLGSAPFVPRRLCELLDACGGDVVGEWTTDDGCITFMTSGKPPVPQCEASTIEGFVDDVKGSYVFGEDGRYRANLEYAGRIVVGMPRDCLRPGLGCADLEDGESKCIARGDRCECSEAFELTSDGEVSGTYETIGSTIEYSDDSPMDYCVEQDRLTMRTISELPRVGGGLSVELQVELRRK